jgi:hypothetical protein
LYKFVSFHQAEWLWDVGNKRELSDPTKQHNHGGGQYSVQYSGSGNSNFGKFGGSDFDPFGSIADTGSRHRIAFLESSFAGWRNSSDFPKLPPVYYDFNNCDQKKFLVWDSEKVKPKVLAEPGPSVQARAYPIMAYPLALTYHYQPVVSSALNLPFQARNAPHFFGSFDVQLFDVGLRSSFGSDSSDAVLRWGPVAKHLKQNRELRLSIIIWAPESLL